jgi:hypothetical protein
MANKFIVVMAVLALSSVGILGQTRRESKLLMGAWKLNVEKSKFSPGPGRKSQVLKWKPSATGFDFSVETVNAQGQATHTMNGQDGHQNSDTRYEAHRRLCDRGNR